MTIVFSLEIVCVVVAFYFAVTRPHIGYKVSLIALWLTAAIYNMTMMPLA
jgi:hypothetical protein